MQKGERNPNDIVWITTSLPPVRLQVRATDETRNLTLIVTVPGLCVNASWKCAGRNTREHEVWNGRPCRLGAEPMDPRSVASMQGILLLLYTKLHIQIR